MKTINKKEEYKNLIAKINKLKIEKNAIILAHYYVDGDIQDIADYTGDSLGLSQQAAKTEADVIVFAGVHFMAETAKILSPEKIVLLSDLEAGCSLADSCPADDFEKFIKQHPNHTVISYVNTTAKVKALTDIICTSSNARQIVNTLPKDQKILFGPDKNLGNYISRETGREIVIWDGACHVHDEFSLERILDLKMKNPDAKIIAHPECQKPILLVSDFIGSTKNLIDFSVNDNSEIYIVVTEPGVLHKMKQLSPNKTFIPAPTDDLECSCSECEFMKKHSLQKIYDCLLNMKPQIEVDEKTRKSALIPIKRMLDISEKLKL